MANKHWQKLARQVCAVVQEQGEWAGAPLPIEGMKLTVAKRYGIQGLEGATFGKDEPPADQEEIGDLRLINSWWSWKKKSWVYVCEDNGRRIGFAHDAENTYLHGIARLLASIEITTVQDHEAELTAMQKLKSMIPDHLYAMYVLQGIFLETSPKSGITYLFRKSRPTLALSGRLRKKMSVIAALCMHPIGYYEESFYGAMVPTDEVIAHLVLMRTDEHRYWRTANQHPPYVWQAGI